LISIKKKYLSFNKLYNKILEQAKMAEHSFMVILAIVIGVLGGMGAIGVRFLIHAIMHLSLGNEYQILIGAIPWYYLILTPAIGGAIVGPTIYFFAREAKGHGVPEVMESVVKRGGIIRKRVAFVKAIATSICIGTGGSTGREGPIVQIGASIGSAIGQMLKLPANKVKTLVGCGAAAGIAATFNAPIAGALFAVEIILGEFGVAQFSPIVISSVIATVVSKQVSGNAFPAFHIPAYELKTIWELVPYAILGLLGAIVAVLFIQVLYFLEDFFEKLPIPDYVKPLIGGLLLGLIGIGFPEIFGTGHAAVESALHGHIVWYLMLALVIIKIISTSVTLGSGGSGGIFAPALFIGAMLGGGFGEVTYQLFHESLGLPPAFPLVTMLVAMGAVVSASIHAPITAILIIFELTAYNYEIILPLMIATIISTLFARKLKKESIYTLKLIRRGVDIESGHETNILKAIQVREVMQQKKSVILSSMKLSDILTYVVCEPHTCYVVENSAGKLLGSFTLTDFKQILLDYEDLKNVVIAEDIVNPKMVFIKEDDNLDYVMKQFVMGDTDELPVLDSDEKKVLGVVWKNDVIHSYNQEMLKANIADGMAGRISSIEKFKAVEVIDGYSMIEIPIPKKFIGETVISANIRVNYGVMIILIRQVINFGEEKEASSFFAPQADYAFESNDKLLLFGKNNKITRVQNL